MTHLEQPVDLSHHVLVIFHDRDQLRVGGWRQLQQELRNNSKHAQPAVESLELWIRWLRHVHGAKPVDPRDFEHRVGEGVCGEVA